MCIGDEGHRGLNFILGEGLLREKRFVFDLQLVQKISLT